MMNSTFEMAVSDWVRVAHELQLECESQDTRQLIVGNMFSMNSFLQQKQNVYEEVKKSDIVAELEEVDSLKDRISHLRSKKGNQSRDVVHEDYLSVYRQLKSTYWQDLFDALIADTSDDVKTILQRLNGILKLCSDRCHQEVSSVLQDSLFSGLYPGETLHKVGAPKVPTEPDQELLEFTTHLLNTSSPFCLPFIQTAILESILAEKRTGTVKLLQTPSPRVEVALRAYLEKCIEFCWIKALHPSTVQLITDPKQECRKLKASFSGVEDVPFSMYVEWPALVQNGEVKCPWQLYYHRGQPRPVAKHPVKTEYNTLQVRAEEAEENLDWERDAGVQSLGQAREEVGLFIEGGIDQTVGNYAGQDNHTISESRSVSNITEAQRVVSVRRRAASVSCSSKFVPTDSKHLKENRTTNVYIGFKYEEKPRVEKKVKKNILF